MNGIKRLLLAVAYLALAVPMFYYVSQDITFGGFGFMYRYLFGAGIILLAILAFLVSPNFKRGVLSVKYSAVVVAPYIWTIVYSLLIWALTTAEFRVLTRGIFYIVYQFIAVLAAAAVLYLFGQKGIYLQLLALFIADGIYILQAIRDNGLGTFVRQYVDLVITLTGSTGEIMKSFELLGHSYGLGFFLVFFLVNFRENRKQLPWAVAAAALFMLGLKRSVLGAVAVAVLVGWLMNWMKQPKRWLQFIMIAAVIFGLCYVYGVSIGLFDWMEEMGMDTNGRSWLFRQFNDYYEIGIGYFGKGAGFVTGSIASGTISLIMDGGYSFAEIHNDFLRQYIELGMAGFIIWMILFLKPRIDFFFHTNTEQAEKRHGVLAAALILVTYVTFMTENSLYHFYTTLFMSTMIMGYHYDEFAERIKLPGE